ncbi:MAG: 1-acyl-sn-glycerol-3-phosphate acyltransferase [Firmicutes bacterium]|nr:1-acyl-sn-glycerol-3-phosphate acyltransferase [Bacillota bacterium]
MFYRFARALLIFIFTLFFRWDVQGRENLPHEGAYMLCANHFSWWDPPAVGAIPKRFVKFMAKEELLKMPLTGKILKALGAFPVKRGAADRRALKTALQILAAGGVLLIFPEGTRSRTGKLLPPQPGVGYIVAKSKVPVVPVGVIGPYKLFRPLRIRIGKPLEFTEYYDVKLKKEQYEEIAKEIMAAIAELLQQK